jgi:ribonuclease P protein component
MRELRFRHEDHIRSNKDFRRAYQLRCTASDDRLLVFASPTGLAHPRLGLSVSRKVGPAVVRNRWKRILREAFRLNRRKLPAGVDLVVIPRPDAAPTLEGLQESLVRLAGRAAARLAKQSNRPRPKKPCD